MKCPIDASELMMTDRQGVEIDYCPTCRGVWLDRGELDKIIDRGNSAAPSVTTQHTQHMPDQNKYKDDQNHRYKKRKKENFLSDLFDF